MQGKERTEGMAEMVVSLKYTWTKTRLIFYLQHIGMSREELVEHLGDMDNQGKEVGMEREEQVIHGKFRVMFDVSAYR